MGKISCPATLKSKSCAANKVVPSRARNKVFWQKRMKLPVVRGQGIQVQANKKGGSGVTGGHARFFRLGSLQPFCENSYLEFGIQCR
jgi:hypothetical protein